LISLLRVLRLLVLEAPGDVDQAHVRLDHQLVEAVGDLAQHGLSQAAAHRLRLGEDPAQLAVHQGQLGLLVRELLPDLAQAPLGGGVEAGVEGHQHAVHGVGPLEHAVDLVQLALIAPRELGAGARVDVLLALHQIGEAHGGHALAGGGGARRPELPGGLDDVVAHLLELRPHPVDGDPQVTDRLLEVLGPDLLLGLRADEVLLDGHQLGVHGLDLDVELRRLRVEVAQRHLGVPLPVALSLRRHGQVLQLLLEGGPLDADLVERRLVLPAQRAGDQRADLADELAADVDDLVEDLGGLGAVGGQVREDAHLARAGHRPLQAHHQRLRLLDVPLQVAHLVGQRQHAGHVRLALDPLGGVGGDEDRDVEQLVHPLADEGLEVAGIRLGLGLGVDELLVDGLELLAGVGEALAGQEEVGQAQVQVAAQDLALGSLGAVRVLQQHDVQRAVGADEVLGLDVVPGRPRPWPRRSTSTALDRGVGFGGLVELVALVVQAPDRQAGQVLDLLVGVIAGLDAQDRVEGGEAEARSPLATWMVPMK
jgi:hypothetical protein